MTGTLLDARRREIYAVLLKYHGNKTKAANHLGMSLRALRDLTNKDPYFADFRHEEKEDEMQGKGQESKQVQAYQPEVFDTKEVVTTLNGLMKRVTEKECTAETVNAACNCASQITQLLRVHLDVERLRRRVQ
jgi:hypothetical protein